MTAASDWDGCAELRSVADALLDRLDPADVGELVGRWSSREALLDALVRRAGLAAAALERDREPVPPSRQPLLVLACLTFNRKSGGVQERTDRTVDAYRRHTRFPDALPEELAVVMTHHPEDADELIPLVAQVNRMLDALPAQGVTAPPFMLDLVVPAVAMVLGRSGAAGGGPAAAAAAARQVLDRGATLADRHLAAGARPAPAAHRSLPILGNADFLRRLAGYRIALGELAGRTDTAGPQALEAATATLADTLYRAMTTVVGRLRLRRGTGDPDVLAAFDQYAEDLGAVAGTREREGRLVRLAYVMRTRHLRSRRPADTADETELPSRADPTGTVGELDLLARWLVAGLFERAGPALQGTILDWLRAEREPDQQRHLPELVGALRVAVFRLTQLEKLPGDSPPLPAGLSGREIAGIVARMTAAVRPAGLSGSRQADTLRVADLALPPLWSRRRAVVTLLAAHRRAHGRRDDTPDKVKVLARAGTRAPGQFFRPDNAADPCCDAGDRLGRDLPGRAAADGMLTCPHRPWGEMGLVDNYRTIRDGTAYSAESVRKLLSRYRGPDREWLLGIQPDLTPGDC